MRIEPKTSPARLLEMLSDRFGAFEAIAYSSIKLARAAPEEDRAMDVLVAEAILEFADDLRAATQSAIGGASATQDELRAHQSDIISRDYG
jgi:hypothetical protein